MEVEGCRILDIRFTCPIRDSRGPLMQQSTGSLSYALEKRASSIPYRWRYQSPAALYLARLFISMLSAAWSPGVGQPFLHSNAIAHDYPPLMFHFPPTIAWRETWSYRSHLWTFILTINWLCSASSLLAETYEHRILFFTGKPRRHSVHLGSR